MLNKNSENSVELYEIMIMSADGQFQQKFEKLLLKECFSPNTPWKMVGQSIFILLTPEQVHAIKQQDDFNLIHRPLEGNFDRHFGVIAYLETLKVLAELQQASETINCILPMVKYIYDELHNGQGTTWKPCKPNIY